MFMGREQMRARHIAPSSFSINQLCDMQWSQNEVMALVSIF